MKFTAPVVALVGMLAVAPSSHASDSGSCAVSDSFGGYVRFEFFQGFYPGQHELVGEVTEETLDKMGVASQEFFLLAARDYQVAKNENITESNINCMTVSADMDDCIFPPDPATAPSFWCNVTFGIDYDDTKEGQELDYINIIASTRELEDYSIPTYILDYLYRDSTDIWYYVTIVEMCPDPTCTSRSGESVRNSGTVTREMVDATNATTTSEGNATTATSNETSTDETAETTAPASSATGLTMLFSFMTLIGCAWLL